MATLETNLVQPSTGTTLTLGASGDTVDIPSGATIDVTGATVTGLTTGKIGQVAYGEVSDSGASVTTAAFMDSGLNVTLTPSATSSKIILMIGGADWDDANTDDRGLSYKFYKNVGGAGDAAIDKSLVDHDTPSSFNAPPYSRIYVDEPSTTSSIEYSLYVKAIGNTVYHFRSGKTYQLIAMEVLA